MARALVTGGSGFIGGHLVERLVERGDHVRCLVRGSSRTDRLLQLGVELITGDLSQRDALKKGVAGVDHVYHLAGLTYALRPQQLTETNVTGTRNVAMACAAAASPPTLVLVSSLAAAGASRAGAVRAEEDAPAPISHYGRSKRGAELAIEPFAGAVPTTVVRPGIVFGPGDPETLLMFRPIARFGVHFVPRYSPPRVSLIYVHDLIRVIIAAAEQGERLHPPAPSLPVLRSLDQPAPTAAGQGYYFACAGEYPDYRELGRMIGRAVGRDSVVMMYMPEPMLLLAAGASEAAGWVAGKPNIFNLDKVREATAAGWVASGAKARRDLRLQKSRDLSEQFHDTAIWYRSQGWF